MICWTDSCAPRASFLVVSREERWLSRAGINVFLSEGRDFGWDMRNRIVLKVRKLDYWWGLHIGTKDLKISLNFLIGLLGLSICLRVIHSGEAYIVFEDLGEFSSKGRDKLGSTIRDYSIVQSEAFKHIPKKSWVIQFASTVLRQGTRITPFIRP